MTALNVSPTATVRRFYDESAESYDRIMDTEIELPVYADTLSRLVERIAGIPGVVIDTSCGTGHMLSMVHERYDPDRPLLGIDLSSRMVAIAKARLGASAELVVGDMRDLDQCQTASAAAVLSFFGIHHLSPTEVTSVFIEWHRVLRPCGQLVVAAWEGSGPIDYGDESDVEAFRYSQDEISTWAEAAGFGVDRCVVEPVEGMDMDAIYLEGIKSEC